MVLLGKDKAKVNVDLYSALSPLRRLGRPYGTRSQGLSQL